MTSEAPPFWWERPDWRAWALWPASFVYGSVAARRMARALRQPVAAPVLCVGNFTVGGAGKTPTAIALARTARKMGLVPGFLSRGHGGSAGKPHLVDVAHDIARHVGDEPLLLASEAATAVTRDRAGGARLLIERGCDFLIMDDGFQSAMIHIDHALVVVDARRGIGNGHTIPGGPMRAPLTDQLRHAQSLLAIGDGDGAALAIRKAARAGRPVHHGRLVPRGAARLAGLRALAFAGIGDPEKFFDTLRGIGCEVAATRRFADHHYYQPDDLAEMLSSAEAAGLALVTTAKDAVRLRHAFPEADVFLERVAVLEVELQFEPASAARRIVEETLDAFARRQHSVGASG